MTPEAKLAIFCFVGVILFLVVYWWFYYKRIKAPHKSSTTDDLENQTDLSITTNDLADLSITTNDSENQPDLSTRPKRPTESPKNRFKNSDVGGEEPDRSRLKEDIVNKPKAEPIAQKFLKPALRDEDHRKFDDDMAQQFDKLFALAERASQYQRNFKRVKKFQEKSGSITKLKVPELQLKHEIDMFSLEFERQHIVQEFLKSKFPNRELEDICKQVYRSRNTNEFLTYAINLRLFALLRKVSIGMNERLSKENGSNSVKQIQSTN